MEELIVAIKELAKTPNIEIWNLVITTILTVFIIFQTYNNNKKINNLTKENTNKQIDLTLLDKRLNVYDTYVKAGIFLTSKSINELITFVPSTEFASNKLFELYEHESKLVTAHNQAKLLFNDKELIDYLREIRNLYTDYLIAFNKLLNFIIELDKARKKEPNNIKNTVKELENLKNSDIEVISRKILDLLENDRFDNMFKDYIIIGKTN